MHKRFLIDSIGWGIILWLIGYILGFIFFPFVPIEIIGWFIIPIALIITLWVLVKRIISADIKYYLKIGAAWALIAIVFDYLFLVKVLSPADGYYKFDVYLYYTIAFILPVLVGWWKKSK